MKNVSIKLHFHMINENEYNATCLFHPMLKDSENLMQDIRYGIRNLENKIDSVTITSCVTHEVVVNVHSLRTDDNQYTNYNNRSVICCGQCISNAEELSLNSLGCVSTDDISVIFASGLTYLCSVIPNNSYFSFMIRKLRKNGYTAVVKTECSFGTYLHHTAVIQPLLRDTFAITWISDAQCSLMFDSLSSVTSSKNKCNDISSFIACLDEDIACFLQKFLVPPSHVLLDKSKDSYGFDVDMMERWYISSSSSHLLERFQDEIKNEHDNSGKDQPERSCMNTKMCFQTQDDQKLLKSLSEQEIFDETIFNGLKSLYKQQLTNKHSKSAMRKSCGSSISSVQHQSCDSLFSADMNDLGSWEEVTNDCARHCKDYINNSREMRNLQAAAAYSIAVMWQFCGEQGHKVVEIEENVKILTSHIASFDHTSNKRLHCLALECYVLMEWMMTSPDGDNRNTEVDRMTTVLRAIAVEESMHVMKSFLLDSLVTRYATTCAKFLANVYNNLMLPIPDLLREHDDLEDRLNSSVFQYSVNQPSTGTFSVGGGSLDSQPSSGSYSSKLYRMRRHISSQVPHIQTTTRQIPVSSLDNKKTAKNMKSMKVAGSTKPKLNTVHEQQSASFSSSSALLRTHRIRVDSDHDNVKKNTPSNDVTRVRRDLFSSSHHKINDDKSKWSDGGEKRMVATKRITTADTPLVKQQMSALARQRLRIRRSHGSSDNPSADDVISESPIRGIAVGASLTANEAKKRRAFGNGVGGGEQRSPRHSIMLTRKYSFYKDDDNVGTRLTNSSQLRHDHVAAIPLPAQTTSPFLSPRSLLFAAAPNRLHDVAVSSCCPAAESGKKTRRRLHLTSSQPTNATSRAGLEQLATALQITPVKSTPVVELTLFDTSGKKIRPKKASTEMRVKHTSDQLATSLRTTTPEKQVSPTGSLQSTFPVQLACLTTTQSKTPSKSPSVKSTALDKTNGKHTGTESPYKSDKTPAKLMTPAKMTPIRSAPVNTTLLKIAPFKLTPVRKRLISGGGENDIETASPPPFARYRTPSSSSDVFLDNTSLRSHPTSNIGSGTLLHRASNKSEYCEATRSKDYTDASSADDNPFFSGKFLCSDAIFQSCRSTNTAANQLAENGSLVSSQDAHDGQSRVHLPPQKWTKKRSTSTTPPVLPTPTKTLVGPLDYYVTRTPKNKLSRCKVVACNVEAKRKPSPDGNHIRRWPRRKRTYDQISPTAVRKCVVSTACLPKSCGGSPDTGIVLLSPLQPGKGSRIRRLRRSPTVKVTNLSPKNFNLFNDDVTSPISVTDSGEFYLIPCNRSPN